MSQRTRGWRVEGISDEQLVGYEIRTHDGPPPHMLALACRACGGTVLVDEVLRVDVVLAAIASGSALGGHEPDCPLVRT